MSALRCSDRGALTGRIRYLETALTPVEVGAAEFATGETEAGTSFVSGLAPT